MSPGAAAGRLRHGRGDRGPPPRFQRRRSVFVGSPDPHQHRRPRRMPLSGRLCGHHGRTSSPMRPGCRWPFCSGVRFWCHPASMNHFEPQLVDTPAARAARCPAALAQEFEVALLDHGRRLSGRLEESAHLLPERSQPSLQNQSVYRMIFVDAVLALLDGEPTEGWHGQAMWGRVFRIRGPADAT